MKPDFSKIVNLTGVSNVYSNNFPPKLLKEAFQELDLRPDSEIKYLWKKHDSKHSLVITSDFILLKNDRNQIVRYAFENISLISFSSDNKIYLYDLDNYIYGTIPAWNFGFSTSNLISNHSRDTINNFLNLFVTREALKSEEEDMYEVALQKIEDLSEIEDLNLLDEEKKNKFANKVIEIYDDFMSGIDVGDVYFKLEYYLVGALMFKKEYTQALTIIDNILNNYKESADLENWYDIKSSVLEEKKDLYGAILCLQKVYSLTSGMQSKLEIDKRIRDISEKFKDDFKNIPLSNRKLILVSDNLKETPSGTFMVLGQNTLPNDLIFPNSNTQTNELYVVHPFKNDSYLLFTDYETQLAKDKIKEFFLVMQCLGATKITHKVYNGSDQQKNKKTNLGVDASLAVGRGPIKNEGGVAVEHGKESSNFSEAVNAHSLTQVFQPKLAPYLPDNLIWYHNELNWHRLYQQRMSGNLLKHRETISSKNSSSVNDIERTNIKIAFKNFFVDTKVNVNYLVDQTFAQNESEEWEIEIEFESVENLKERYISGTSVNDTKPNTDENEYIDEVKYMLEDDGLIDEKERKSLERFRLKKLISKERATELENKLVSQVGLNSDEIDYLEEFREILNDGEITEKERRILNRHATRLKISAERASEIERYV